MKICPQCHNDLDQYLHKMDCSRVGDGYTAPPAVPQPAPTLFEPSAATALLETKRVCAELEAEKARALQAVRSKALAGGRREIRKNIDEAVALGLDNYEFELKDSGSDPVVNELVEELRLAGYDAQCTQQPTDHVFTKLKLDWSKA